MGFNEFLLFIFIKHCHLNKKRRTWHIGMALGNAVNPVRSISLHTVTIPGSVLSNYQADKKRSFHWESIKRRPSYTTSTNFKKKILVVSATSHSGGVCQYNFSDMYCGGVLNHVAVSRWDCQIFVLGMNFGYCLNSKKSQLSGLIFPYSCCTF